MRQKIKSLLRRWLGVENDRQYLDWLAIKAEAIRQELYDQINMVGIDHMIKKDQSVIIYVSRLGGGTVRVVPAYFKSVSEMLDLIRFTERSVHPDRVVIDAPYGMGKMIDEERRRRR